MVHESNDLSAVLPRTMRSLIKRMGQALETEGLELNALQLRLLHFIDENQDPVQTAVASYLGQDKSAVLRHVDVLEEHGWIERQMDPNDRRRKHLVLSKAGASILRKGRKVKDRVFNAAVKGIPANEIAVCISVLERLERKAAAAMEQEP